MRAGPVQGEGRTSRELDNSALTNLPLKQILQGDSAQVLKTLPDNCIDLTVTSPPYDNLRTYNGFTFDFETIAKELFRVTKEGGVLVWVVGNQVIDGDETDTAERQIIRFKELGWRKHDTMIYAKQPRFQEETRYSQVWEYMIIFSKGKPKTVKLLKEVKLRSWLDRWVNNHATTRDKDGQLSAKKYYEVNPEAPRPNIWYYDTGYINSTKDRIAFKHPAIFPEALAEDNILSWSNEGDVILDPFAGSGTTLKVAEKLGRSWIGIEVSTEYIEIAKARLAPMIAPNRLF